MGVDLAVFETAPASGVEWCYRRIDRTDAKAITREESEIVAYFIIDTLRRVGRDTHQLIGCVRHELRICP